MSDRQLSLPSAWSNIGGVFDAPCHMCGAATEDRVAVGDGCAPICSLECELRFEGERQAVNGIVAALKAAGHGDAAEQVYMGEWRKP